MHSNNNNKGVPIPINAIKSFDGNSRVQVRLPVMTQLQVWVKNKFKMEKGTYAMFCLCFAIFCLVLAFASPYWVESFAKSDNEFVKCGLWEFCFNDYTFWKDYNGKRFLGCWYIFSDQYRPLWEWLSPRK